MGSRSMKSAVHSLRALQRQLTDCQFTEGVHTEEGNKDGEWSREEATQRAAEVTWFCSAWRRGD